MTQVMAEFLSVLGLITVQVMGYSLGAAIILNLARNNPERVAGITFLNAAGWGNQITTSGGSGHTSQCGLAQERPVPSSAVANDMSDNISVHLVDDAGHIIHNKKIGGS